MDILMRPEPLEMLEQGIPLETFRVRSGSGRSIAAYKFGDLLKIVDDKLGGRKVFSKEFKSLLIARSGGRCYVCLGKFEERYLQVDHRVPYEISTDKNSHKRNLDDYMLLCGSCNRAKSWSCENCDNWKRKKSPAICKSCYWVFPEEYAHIAENKLRRLDMIWLGKEISEYDKLKKLAKGNAMPLYIKEVLKRHIGNLSGK